MSRSVLIYAITAISFIIFSVEFVVRKSIRVSPPPVVVNPPRAPISEHKSEPPVQIPLTIPAPKVEPSTQCADIIKQFEHQKFLDSVYRKNNSQISPSLREAYRNCTKE